MKKSFLIYLKEGLFIFVFVIFMFSTIMHLSTPTGAVSIDNSIEYQELANGDYTVSGFYGEERKVWIPEHYQNGKVVGIESEVFKDSDVYEINLPESVEFFGYHSLNTDQFLKMIVVDNTSEFYTTILDDSNFNGTMVSMIENEYLQAVVNGKIIEESNYYHVSTEKSLVVTLSVIRKESYRFEDGVWKPSNSSFHSLFTDDAEISWLYNGELYTNEVYLDIEDVSQMDGVFSAIYDDEELFRIDLSKNQTSKESSVETGISPNTTTGLLIAAMICILLIIKLLKVKRILNGE